MIARINQGVRMVPPPPCGVGGEVVVEVLVVVIIIVPEVEVVSPIKTPLYNAQHPINCRSRAHFISHLFGQDWHFIY